MLCCCSRAFFVKLSSRDAPPGVYIELGRRNMHSVLLNEVIKRGTLPGMNAESLAETICVLVSTSALSVVNTR